MAHSFGQWKQAGGNGSGTICYSSGRSGRYPLISEGARIGSDCSVYYIGLLLHWRGSMILGPYGWHWEIKFLGLANGCGNTCNCCRRVVALDVGHWMTCLGRSLQKRVGSCFDATRIPQAVFGGMMNSQLLMWYQAPAFSPSSRSLFE